MDIVHGVTDPTGTTFTHPSLTGATAQFIGVDGFIMYPASVATQTGNAFTFDGVATITLTEPKGIAVPISVIITKPI